MKKEIYSAANFRATVTVIIISTAIAVMVRKYMK